MSDLVSGLLFGLSAMMLSFVAGFALAEGLTLLMRRGRRRGGCRGSGRGITRAPGHSSASHRAAEGRVAGRDAVTATKAR